jgi:hypothetical protein
MYGIFESTNIFDCCVILYSALPSKHEVNEALSGLNMGETISGMK